MATALSPITPQPGSTPDPGDVVGRDEIITTMLAGARAGTNHLLSDPRRMGKTSVLIRLCNEPGANTHAVKVDLEGAKTADEVVVRIFQGIARHRPLLTRAGKQLAKYLDGINVEVGPISVATSTELSTTSKALGAHQALESCLKAINDSLDDSWLIIALDEVTIAANNIAARDPQACNELLQTLRRLRGDSYKRIRWILSGSIGFHHVLRKANSTEGAINDLLAVELGPLGDDHARSLAGALFAGINRKADDAIITHLVERTGGIPFMLHSVAHGLAASSQQLTIDEVELAITTYLADTGKSGAWTHLVTRVDKYYENPQLALDILDLRARAGDEPTSFAELVEWVEAHPVHADTNMQASRTVIDDLVDDHYLDNTHFAWRYPVLRETWMTKRRLR